MRTTRIRNRVAYLLVLKLLNLPLLVETSPSTTPSTANRRTEQPTVFNKYGDYYAEVEWLLNKTQSEIERRVLVSYNSQGNAYKSTAYTFDDFLVTLRSMSLFGAGVGDDDDPIMFYMGQTDSKGIAHGLANLAAFLAQAKVTSFKYDVCDEFNVDTTDLTSKYAISNSCGQWGRSYQNEVCMGDGAFMTCDVDPDMAVTAASSIFASNVPPPFECQPKKNATDFTGHWDAELELASEIYPYANRAGAIHNEGCCWWGRGVLFTRGTCKFGRFNRFLGSQAKEHGFSNFYPVDICSNPEIVCEGRYTRDLRWIVGYFDWADTVQTYQNTLDGWDYMKELNTFIETDFADTNRFIDVVGMALPFGCLESTCLRVEDKVKQERRDNFVDIVFNIFNLPLIVKTSHSLPPSLMPTLPQSLQLSTTPTQQPMSQSVSTTPNPSLPPSLNPSPTSTQQPVSQYNICDGQSSTLIPINECRDYVQCQNGNQVSQQSCPEGLLFDSVIGQCNWADSVYACDVSLLTPSSPSIESPVSSQTSHPQNGLPLSICDGQSYAIIPINGCRDYVQCQNGNLISQQKCLTGLLFDSATGQCNWADSVNACDAPLHTMLPTLAPTPFPTSLPTEKFIPLTPGPIFSTPRPISMTPRPIFATPRPAVQSKLPTFSPSSSELTNGRDILTALVGNCDQLDRSYRSLWMAVSGLIFFLHEF